MSRVYIYPNGFLASELQSKSGEGVGTQVVDSSSYLYGRYLCTQWNSGPSIAQFLGQLYTYINEAHQVHPDDEKNLATTFFMSTLFTYTILKFIRYNIESNAQNQDNVEKIYLPPTIVNRWHLFVIRLGQMLGRRVTWFDLLYGANFIRGQDTSANKPLDERFLVLFTFSGDSDMEAKFIRRIIYCNGPLRLEQIQPEIVSAASNNAYFVEAMTIIRRGLVDNINLDTLTASIESGWKD